MLSQGDKYILITFVITVLIVLILLYRASKRGPVKKDDVNNRKGTVFLVVCVAILFVGLVYTGNEEMVNKIMKYLEELYNRAS